jgi:hypothetical protein
MLRGRVHWAGGASGDPAPARPLRARPHAGRPTAPHQLVTAVAAAHSVIAAAAAVRERAAGTPRLRSLGELGEQIAISILRD